MAIIRIKREFSVFELICSAANPRRSETPFSGLYPIFGFVLDQNFQGSLQLKMQNSKQEAVHAETLWVQRFPITWFGEQSLESMIPPLGGEENMTLPVENLEHEPLWRMEMETFQHMPASQLCQTTKARLPHGRRTKSWCRRRDTGTNTQQIHLLCG